jgi:hypothetical protein
MDPPDERHSSEKLEADDVADPTGGGGSNLKEFLAGVGAFLTAVIAVGGGIYVLSRDAGSLHRGDTSASVSTAVAPPASMQPPTSPAEGPRASSATIYRCEVQGKTVYANAPCSSRNIRPVDVFVNRGFEPVDASALRARKSAGDESLAVVSLNDQARAGRCKQITDAIRRIDQTERPSQSGQMQDGLTQQKRQLLDKEHELKC